MNTEKLSTDEIRDLFEDAFAEQVGLENGIDTFDIECTRESSDQSIVVSVNVAGFAGTPTIDDFRDGNVLGADAVIISRDDVGDLEFALDRDDIAFLSGNDYQLVYRAD